MKDKTLTIKIRLLFALVMLVFCFGCKKEPIVTDSLIGLYKVTFPHGSESLQLETNNSFIQIYTRMEDGKTATNLGTWKCDASYSEVVLLDALLFDNRRGQRNEQTERTVWRLPIKSRFGEISLYIGEDVAEYKKLK